MRSSSLERYRSWKTLPSFLVEGLEVGAAAESMRRVSGASSHRLGLEAALSVLERCGRATTSGLAKVHCFNCEVTATSTMIAEGEWNCTGVAGPVGDISDWLSD